MKKKKLKKWLKQKLKEANSNGEECIQELDNDEEGNVERGKAEAFEEVINYLKE